MKIDTKSKDKRGSVIRMVSSSNKKYNNFPAKRRSGLQLNCSSVFVGTKEGVGTEENTDGLFCSHVVIASDVIN